MRPIATLLVALVASLVAGCGASLAYTADYDPSAEFTQRRTWAWYPSPAERNRRIDNDILDARIRFQIAEQLASQGYSPAAEGAEPDLWVNYDLNTREGMSVQSTNTFYNYANVGWGYSVYYPSTVQTTVREYTTGTLIIDILDPGSRQLIWRGTASTELDGTRSTEERHTILREAVAGILQYFPPS